jgi:hypothetical protein
VIRFPLVYPFKSSKRFRWVFCQLETLRHCLPPSVRRTLNELPDSLDETYERILKEIKKPNRDNARRLLQCLVVAIRPLRVDELAEVLAVDFDDVEGIPKLNPNWRWEDQEHALLSSCSSLIAIVDTDDAPIVQFSHFSVKEFLTSPRLATPSRETSHYYIVPEPAHMILAQACLGVLLQLDDRVEQNDVEAAFPLAGYAARHWVSHAQFENASSGLRSAMEYLFDIDKPYFKAWLRMHDIDLQIRGGKTFFYFTPYDKLEAAPLYYAALCGFHDLTKDLIVKYPSQVNADSGYYVRPLVAALAQRHFRTADLLRLNGADPCARGDGQTTPLHDVAYRGDLEMVHKLIDYGVDINAVDVCDRTPLYQASKGRYLRCIDAIRLLLEHSADVNARADNGSTALHRASEGGNLEIVRVLLEHGANVEAQDGGGKTAYQLALAKGHHNITEVLSEYGAKGS